MRKLLLFIFIFFIQFFSCLNTFCAETNYVNARLIADTKAIVPGHPFKLGVELSMQPGWHTYYKNPGDAGLPTKIIWQLPPGFKSKGLYWQKPNRFNEKGIITYGYTGQTLIATEIIPPEQLTTQNIKLQAQIKWLSCKDLCLPGSAQASLVLPADFDKIVNFQSLAINNAEFSAANIFDNQQPLLSTQTTEQPQAKEQLLLYFAFAFLGGLLLNFMPCVLPVVAIKILSLLGKTDKQDIRKTIIAFSGGILCSFLFLGLIVIVLQSAGHKIGWGFQFQQPFFLMLMSALVLLFALSLFGMFEFSFNLNQKTMNNLCGKEGIIGDFAKGVFATVLSTPCTAPFLGTALGFAFVQPKLITLTIFLAIGLGMCLPYLFLLCLPQYIKLLPKPGNWMIKLKEAFGFLLLFTTIWLVSILYYQVPVASATSFVYFLLSLAFSIWLIHSFSNLTSSPARLQIVRALSLIIVLLSAIIFIYPNKDSLLNSTKYNTIGQTNSNQTQKDTEAFNPQKLAAALNEGKTVFLDFTAKWCLTCQFNEVSVINTPEVQSKLHSLNAVLFKADWTRQDQVITDLLQKFGRSGVPLYVIYPGKDPNKPIILPEIITKEMVLNKLDQAGPSRSNQQ